MNNIASRLIAISIVYAIAGMALGIVMGISGDHSDFPVHAHVNLVGWVTLALYGLIYHAFPRMAEGWLATLHFWLANAGALILSIGVYLVLAHKMEQVVIVGSLLTIAGGIAFLVNFLKHKERTA